MALVYEPGDALSFRQPFSALTQDQLRLTNKNNSPIAFKVKTTAPKQYCVRPNAGRIESGGSVEVQVVLQPMKEDPPADFKCRDKFLIQSIQITPEMESMPMSELWAMVEREAKSSISEKKLRVRYLPSEPAKQEATDAAKPGTQQSQQQQQRAPAPTRPLPGPSPLGRGVAGANGYLPDEESADNMSAADTASPAIQPSSPVAATRSVEQPRSEASPATPAASASASASARLFPADSAAASPADTTGYADTSAPSAIASTGSANATLSSAADLEKAQATIADLRRQLGEYKNIVDASSSSKTMPVAQTTRTVDGLSMQSVAIVALVAFMTGYFFF
ncbi:phosphatidylinositol-binding protein scs2 [Coemansia sp. Benny D115]|nr:phosphatidylinositol-binding protein scs2 [Coemansia sp. Benny D115]